MLTLAVAAAVTVFVWWAATGAMFYVTKLPSASYPSSLAVLTGLAFFSIWTVDHLSGKTEASAAYCGFVCAVAVWAWQEAAFLMGVLTGRKTASRKSGLWAHFMNAAGAMIYHELALAITMVGLLALTWGEPNQTAAWTFAALWIMRISAKLNLFLGVPNFDLDMLPRGLQHLRPYFARKPMNLLFPFSVTLGTAAAVGLGVAAARSGIPPVESTALAMLSALIALAVLEHWFMVLPLSDSVLWNWVLRRAEAWSERAGNENTPAEKTGDGTLHAPEIVRNFGGKS